jgi:flavin-dependent dehydrogenase
MYDLIVIGGGPGGSSAAITASRAGAQVLFLERGSLPRHKVCGEFVSAESLDLLHGLLNLAHQPLLKQAIRIARTRVFLDGQALETAVDPPAASIARFDLDAALWASAQDCRVDTRQRVTVQNISGRGPFHVITSGGDFESRAVINASGRWSNLTADTSRNNGFTEKWVGLKGHFSEPATQDSVDLYFFDGGYCGIQPVSRENANGNGSRINACAMVRATIASTIQEVFSQHPQLKERSRNWTPLSDPVSTSPLIFRAPQPERDGILVAGDAAVFVDPFIGDGISLALRSGTMAAQSLIPFFRNEHSLQAAALAYRTNYDEKLAPVFKASSMIRRMLALPRAIRIPMIYFVRSAPGVARYLVKRTR